MRNFRPSPRPARDPARIPHHPTQAEQIRTESAPAAALKNHVIRKPAALDPEQIERKIK